MDISKRTCFSSIATMFDLVILRRFDGVSIPQSFESFLFEPDAMSIDRENVLKENKVKVEL